MGTLDLGSTPHTQLIRRVLQALDGAIIDSLGWARFAGGPLGSRVSFALLVMLTLALTVCQGARTGPDTTDPTDASDTTDATDATDTTDTGTNPATDDPLPGYVPDPEIFAQAPDPELVLEVPAHPGLRAAVNQMLVVLAEGADASAAERVATAVGGEVVGQVPGLGSYQLSVPTSTMVELQAAFATVAADADVAAAGYDFIAELRACPHSSDLRELDPADRCPWEDPGYFALLDIFGEEVGENITLSNVAVAVIDSGIAIGNGEFDEARIANVHNPGGVTTGMTDPVGHGTKVAGVITADDGDGGVSGIASRLLGEHLRVLYGRHPNASDGLTNASQILAATELAIGAGAQVVNFSFGFGPLARPDTAVWQDFDRLAAIHPNVLFVAGANNRNLQLTGWNDAPAGIPRPNVLTVGSSMPCSPTERVPASAFGIGVEIVAQGENMRLVDPASGRPAILDSGTSFATPQVVSAAAVLRAIDPTLTAELTRGYLIDYAAAGPDSTAGRSLNLAGSVLQLLYDLGSPLVDQIDAGGDGVADAPGSVAASVCGVSTVTVEGLGTEEFPSTNTDEGTVAEGNAGASGFALILQKPGNVNFGLVCENCDFEVGSHPLGPDAVPGVTVGAYSAGLAAGGITLSGSWTVSACTIQQRWPEAYVGVDTPQIVLVESEASGVLEVNTADGTLEDEPLPFEGRFQVPFTIEPLAETDPLVVELEASCEGGRSN